MHGRDLARRARDLEGRGCWAGGEGEKRVTRAEHDKIARHCRCEVRRRGREAPITRRRHAGGRTAGRNTQGQVWLLRALALFSSPTTPSTRAAGQRHSTFLAYSRFTAWHRQPRVSVAPYSCPAARRSPRSNPVDELGRDALRLPRRHRGSLALADNPTPILALHESPVRSSP